MVLGEVGFNTAQERSFPLSVLQRTSTHFTFASLPHFIKFPGLVIKLPRQSSPCQKRYEAQSKGLGFLWGQGGSSGELSSCLHPSLWHSLSFEKAQEFLIWFTQVLVGAESGEWQRQVQVSMQNDKEMNPTGREKCAWGGAEEYSCKDIHGESRGSKQ